MKTASRPGRHPATGTARWIITITATALSAYALDAVAATAGLLLVASQVLHGLTHATALLFLAATYLLWGAGLR